jgi:pyruvate kinase
MKQPLTKKTKIVATLGPASSDVPVLKDMINAGLNVVRLNFSHGTHDDHANTVRNVRKAGNTLKNSPAILQDLCGPKIRLGNIEPGTVLDTGKQFILSTKKMLGDATRASISYKKLTKDVQKGATIKIDDGKVALTVNRVTDTDIYCTVTVGGAISSHKGVNFPDTELSLSSLTAKDKKDVLFGITNKLDYIALSFVQKAQDIKDLRKILHKHKSTARIIAKIETQAAIANLGEIINEADGVMVARGDLAVEVGAEKVPLLQKEIISRANRLGRPVITATQMLDSMEHSPVPTRAEVSDVANSILDGTDAVMLSSESAVGEYPVEAVATLSRIADHVEPHGKNRDLHYLGDSRDIVDTMSVSVVRIANHVKARRIVTLTQSGFTARMIARFKPHHGVVAITPLQTTYEQLKLSYGCTPVVSDIKGDTKKVSKAIQKIIKKNDWANKGEKIVVTMGSEYGVSGSTNTIFIVDAI